MEGTHSSMDGRDVVSEDGSPVSSVDVPVQAVVPSHSVPPPVNESSPAVQPTVGRPVRTRKPNVRYNAEEYDLSKVSGTKKVITDQGWKKAKRRRKLSP